MDDLVPSTPTGLEVQVAAVLLGRAGRDTVSLVNELGEQLAAAWPAAVEVTRKGMGKRRRAVSLKVRLADKHFDLKVVEGRPVATVAHVHGGITLSHASLTVAEWVNQLVAELASLSGQLEEARVALERLTAG